MKHAWRIQEIVKEIEDTVTEEIEVDPKYHRILIGSNGSAMREIAVGASRDLNSGSSDSPGWQWWQKD